jgi:hypothetical protein
MDLPNTRINMIIETVYPGHGNPFSFEEIILRE